MKTKEKCKFCLPRLILLDLLRRERSRRTEGWKGQPENCRVYEACSGRPPQVTATETTHGPTPATGVVQSLGINDQDYLCKTEVVFQTLINYSYYSSSSLNYRRNTLYLKPQVTRTYPFNKISVLIDLSGINRLKFHYPKPKFYSHLRPSFSGPFQTR